MGPSTFRNGFHAIVFCTIYKIGRIVATNIWNNIDDICFLHHLKQQMLLKSNVNMFKFAKVIYMKNGLKIFDILLWSSCLIFH
jgi:hypothetical protein